MKTLTVGFSRAATRLPIFSWLIMLVERTNYSHAYIKYHNESVDRDIILQAKGLNVNVVGLVMFKTEELIVKEFIINVPDDKHIAVIQYVIDKLGQPYSMLQILNSAIYLATNKNLFNNEIFGWDCSKLVADLLESQLGYKIPEDLDIITPKMLCQYMENL